VAPFASEIAQDPVYQTRAALLLPPIIRSGVVCAKGVPTVEHALILPNSNMPDSQPSRGVRNPHRHPAPHFHPALADNTFYISRTYQRTRTILQCMMHRDVTYSQNLQTQTRCRHKPLFIARSNTTLYHSIAPNICAAFLSICLHSKPFGHKCLTHRWICQMPAHSISTLLK
jgi:hypothetical protein